MSAQTERERERERERRVADGKSGTDRRFTKKHKANGLMEHRRKQPYLALRYVL